MKVVVLCSGGMDSVTALHWASREHTVVAAVSFDYGAKHNHREIPFAAEHAARVGARHEVIALEFVDRLFASDLLKSGGEIPEGHYEAENMKQTVVPFRNAIMLSIACGFAESVGAQGLVIAAHGGDHAIYPDCREDFMRALGEAMRLGTYAGIELLRPFRLHFGFGLASTYCGLCQSSSGCWPKHCAPGLLRPSPRALR